MIFYMREKLCEAIRESYPDKANKYLDFYLDVEFKESTSSTFSGYSFDKKKIKVNTLSRSPGDIFISMLQEAAKHIDIKERQETHNDRPYLMILRKLLQTSLERNIIGIEDLHRLKNEKLKKLLQENFGSFSSWKFETNIPEGKIYIHVFDSFMIKNVLKAYEYIYDANQTCWSKRIDVNKSDDEQEFVNKYKNMAEFVIMSDNRFYIRPVYLIRVKSFAIEFSKVFRAYWYDFKKDTKYWEKIVYAADIKTELAQIEDIPKQKVIIQKNS